MLIIKKQRIFNSLIYLTLMKKTFFYMLLLAVLPLCGLAGCSDDDDDLPDVTFSLEISNGVSVDGTIYIVRGETFKIDAVNVKNLQSDKAAIISAATYYWDKYRLGTSVVAPYGFEFVTSEDTPLGRHEIAIECPVYAVDKSPAVANLFYRVEVVESADDIPDGDTTTPPDGNAKILPS